MTSPTAIAATISTTTFIAFPIGLGGLFWPRFELSLDFLIEFDFIISFNKLSFSLFDKFLIISLLYF